MGMLPFEFESGRGLNSALCIGAHCDDIEIGCGGTIFRLLEACPKLAFYWLILSSDDQRAAEARRSARRVLGKLEGHELDIQTFRNSYFPYVGAEIKQHFERLKTRVNPDLILTHHTQDLHQDHRIAAELTYNTFRDHLILEYEVPKYDGGLGSPQIFVPLSVTHLQKKVDYLLKGYPSQLSHRWFTEETFRGLARLRGIECNAAEGYAEAFYLRKAVVLKLETKLANHPGSGAEATSPQR